MPPTLYEQLTAQRAAKYASQEADNAYLQNAPNAGAGWGAGLLEGFSSRLQQRQLESQLQLEDAKSRAREFVQAIPLNEHNFPIALRLMAEIDAQKPSKRSFIDLISAKPDPNEAAMGRIYSLLKGSIPADANLPREEITEAITGEGNSIRTKVDIPADPEKFQFQSQGNFQALGGVFHGKDEGGRPTSYSLVVDKKTGLPKAHNLGQDLRSSSEVVAQTRAEQQEKLALERSKNPIFQKMLANTGLASVSELLELSKDRYVEEYTKAKKEFDADKQLSRDVKESIITRNNQSGSGALRDPQTGRTPAQDLAEKNRKFDTANRLFNDFVKAQSEFTQAQGRLQGSFRKRPGTTEPLYGTDLKTGEPILISPREQAAYSAAKGEVAASQKLMNSYGDMIESQFSDIYKVTRDANGNVISIKPLPGAGQRFAAPAAKGARGTGAPSRSGLINRSAPPPKPVGKDWDAVMGRGSGVQNFGDTGYKGPKPPEQ